MTVQTKAQAERRESDREEKRTRTMSLSKALRQVIGKRVCITFTEQVYPKVIASSVTGRLSSVSVHQLRLVTDGGAVTVQMPAVAAWELIEP